MEQTDSLRRSSNCESQRLNTEIKEVRTQRTQRKPDNIFPLPYSIYEFLFFISVSSVFSVVKLFFLRSAGSLAPRMLD